MNILEEKATEINYNKTNDKLMENQPIKIKIVDKGKYARVWEFEK